MKEGAVCIILWFSTSDYGNWKLIFSIKVNFQKAFYNKRVVNIRRMKIKLLDLIRSVLVSRMCFM